MTAYQTQERNWGKRQTTQKWIINYKVPTGEQIQINI